MAVGGEGVEHRGWGIHTEDEELPAELGQHPDTI